MFKNHGKVGVARVYDLPHVADELRNGNSVGTVDEILQYPINPVRCCRSVIHGGRRSSNFNNNTATSTVSVVVVDDVVSLGLRWKQWQTRESTNCRHRVVLLL